MNLSGKDSFKPKGKTLLYLHYQFNIRRASFPLEYLPHAWEEGTTVEGTDWHWLLHLKGS